ncbi:4Fe-4S binding protein [Rhodopseudomonas sp. HC1]|uniref:4Fe-4S binding protein n=1 Tax=Rhodopseudomonas infernalis TaxID=2897386 RepID=UPI001EE8C4B0|nr:4Fe-4S binding protein [Rhodopseudomonas infernalis]MCG6204488.1 4Fe-4S binding protein [Rhodopseudomonas infernalis]
MRSFTPKWRRASASDLDAGLAALGDWLGRHRRAVAVVQWAVVLIYLALLIVPPLLPMPEQTARIWSNLTLAAQFAFWGIWWPFVLLSMVLFGRLWCGVLCPEGSLSETISARSRGYAVPGWITWKGWPFVAFSLTTIYGQMISVYQYPQAALVLLGGSTVGAVVIGWFYGRNKRVWCRYLCPVSRVFGVLAKLAPLHYRVDLNSWQSWQKPRGGAPARVDCAPLVAIGTMKGSAACHMCGRCSGFRGAVTLARRSPNHEIVNVAGSETNAVETLVILFGLLGLAAGAFHWGSSSIYIAAKQFSAEWLIEHRLMWPLEATAPWWIFTNYPDQSDVMTLLDGAVLIGYLLLFAALVGIGVGGGVAVATRWLGAWSPARFHHMVQSLIPLAGCGVFLGLSMTTVTLLGQNGIFLDFVAGLRATMLIGAAAWSLWLGWRIAGIYAGGRRRVAAMLPLAIGVTAAAAVWASLFWRL